MRYDFECVKKRIFRVIDPVDHSFARKEIESPAGLIKLFVIRGINQPTDVRWKV